MHELLKIRSFIKFILLGIGEVACLRKCKNIPVQQTPRKDLLQSSMQRIVNRNDCREIVGNTVWEKNSLSFTNRKQIIFHGWGNRLITKFRMIFFGTDFFTLLNYRLPLKMHHCKYKFEAALYKNGNQTSCDFFLKLKAKERCVLLKEEATNWCRLEW